MNQPWIPADIMRTCAKPTALARRAALGNLAYMELER